MKSTIKPYSPNNHCDKCNFDYPHFNSTFTKCPRCEELKQLKGNEKDNNTRERSSIRSGKRKASICSERAGRKVRKLTSESASETEGSIRSYQDFDRKKAKNPIPKVSSKQGKINNEFEKLKAQIEHDRDPWCESCGSPNNLDPSHLIPKSKRKDLFLDPNNISVQCRSCHEALEHLDVFKIRKFRNLNKILEYIESVDSARFIHVTDKLYNQLNYSK